MKRSQAIKILANQLVLTGNHYNDDGRDLEDSEKILSMMEKFGMVPPEVKEPCETLYLDHTGQVVKGEDSFVFVHRWEAEDEA
jgi:hypothetical protein